MYLLINSTSCFLDNYIPSVINIFLLIYNCIKFISKIICKKEKKKKRIFLLHNYRLQRINRG